MVSATRCICFYLTARAFRGVTTSYLDILNDSNSVGNIKGIVVLAQSNVALLQSPRSDEGVNLLAFNVVKFSDGGLDLTLIGLNIDNKNKCVAVFDQLHGRLSGERVLDDGKCIKTSLLWGALSLILGLARGLQSLRLVEVDLRVDAGSLLGDTLLKGICHC